MSAPARLNHEQWAQAALDRYYYGLVVNKATMGANEYDIAYNVGNWIEIAPGEQPTRLTMARAAVVAGWAHTARVLLTPLTHVSEHRTLEHIFEVVYTAVNDGYDWNWCVAKLDAIAKPIDLRATDLEIKDAVMRWVDQNPPIPKAAEDAIMKVAAAKGKVCLACYDNKCASLILCGHVFYCDECAKKAMGAAPTHKMYLTKRYPMLQCPLCKKTERFVPRADLRFLRDADDDADYIPEAKQLPWAEIEPHVNPPLDPSDVLDFRNEMEAQHVTAANVGKTIRYVQIERTYANVEVLLYEDCIPGILRELPKSRAGAYRFMYHVFTHSELDAATRKWKEGGAERARVQGIYDALQQLDDVGDFISVEIIDEILARGVADADIEKEVAALYDQYA